MLFKNSFHLLIENFSLNYKFLLYKLIVWLLGLALSAALLYPTLRMVYTSQAFEDVVQLFRDFLRAVASGNSEFLTTFADTLKDKTAALAEFLQEKTPNVVFFCVSAVVIMLVTRFLGGIGVFTFGNLIDGRMSSFARLSFSGSYIRNLGKACLWQVIYVPITFVFDALVLALCYVVFLFLMVVISMQFAATIVALMISVALFLAAQALKMTLFSDAIPALVSDRLGVGAALRRSFSFKKGVGRFGSLFSTYLISALIIMCVNVLCAVATFGAALLITVPMSYLLLICIQFVSYYTYGKRKYFLSEDQIVSPKKDKDHENFYDNFEL